MCDLIRRQDAIDALEKVAELYPWRVPGDRDSYSKYNEAWNDALDRAESEIEALPSAQPDLSEYSDKLWQAAYERGKAEAQQKWILFKRRKPTEEEGTAFDYIMDCKCPEDGQNILVSINIQGHEPVQYDTFYGGGGEECCLESGYELVEEATAWMPLPEPYREEGE